jgi:alkyl sulfatase BDS1-like metallo-beta-lactamase superfamily hydrolase
MIGGATAILAKGRELINQGEYRSASKPLNKHVYAEPLNQAAIDQAAKDLLADAFEQSDY